MEHEEDDDTSCNRCARYNHQRNGKGTRRIRNKYTVGGHLNDIAFKIGQDTKKSPEDLRRFVVTQTPVKDHQLILA